MSATDRGLRVLAIAIVAALAVIGMARPALVLVGGLAWLPVVLVALAGLGSLAARVRGVEQVDFGLRAAWGVGVYLAIIGVLVALGVATRPAVLALATVGVVGCGWHEWVTPRPLWRIARDGVRALRARPAVGAVAIALGAVALVHIAGAIARLDRSAWDDDVAYTAFVKRLLDAGDLIEPFSFRRLAAYGGQTALQALFGARGSILSVHALDQGVGFALVLLLVVGYARELGRVSALWLAIIVMSLLLVPDISVNTASYWTGVALFLALHRTLVRGELVMAGLLAAAACTLRHSYLPVVAFVIAIWLVARLAHAARTTSWREGWRGERRAWSIVVGTTAVALLAWIVASVRSSGTPLFPFIGGTWNHGLELAPSGRTWLDDVAGLVGACVDTLPLMITPVLVVLIALARDRRAGKPLQALLVATVLGVALLVHGFAAADAFSIWRYAVGPALALALVFALELGDVTNDGGDVSLPALGRWALLAALIVQLGFLRAGVAKRYALTFHDLALAGGVHRTGEPTTRVDARHYAAMQAAVPAGGAIAIMLDDPELLDYARNPIANLDVPGFASPDPQLPSFQGPAAMRAYFVGRGLRYLAFVRPERSRYVFRRDFWVWRIFNDSEFFQVMSEYSIDAIDTFTALARDGHVLYDADGLVVVDLGDRAEPAPLVDPATEVARRAAYVRALVAREHFEPQYALTTREDLVFVDGTSDLTVADPDADPRWTDFAPRESKPKSGLPIRWLHPRVHLRVRNAVLSPGHAMHFAATGHVNVAAVYSRPRIDVALAGELLGSFEVDERGAFMIDLQIDAGKLADWRDLYLVFDSLGQPDREAKDLRVARLEHVTWEPR